MYRYLFCLTLSVPAEYMYSTASHASRPDGVLVLRNFQKVVKWPSWWILKFKYRQDWKC
jgi:hypothetical protein